MGSQMAYVYNAHRHSAIPFRSLLITHLDQRLQERLQKSFWDQSNQKRWAGTEWWDEKELDGLWKGESAEATSTSKPVATELTEEEIMEALNDGPAGESARFSFFLMNLSIHGSSHSSSPHPSFRPVPSAQPTPSTSTSTSAAAPVSLSPLLSADPDAPHPKNLVGPRPSRSAQENVVYLTADSPNEIDALEEGMTYVIGGIVDHNRYKVSSRLQPQ